MAHKNQQTNGQIKTYETWTGVDNNELFIHII